MDLGYAGDPHQDWWLAKMACGWNEPANTRELSQAGLTATSLDGWGLLTCGVSQHGRVGHLAAVEDRPLWGGGLNPYEPT
ncbi:hypothetical protein [Limnobacter sp.]|uniref:hypothetical protein n=1 Tax=Limnobacter sp. TaxID=2003368 RepID=UPI0025BB5704|nr:hypothetical protein [Limnobacter sp.]